MTRDRDGSTLAVGIPILWRHFYVMKPCVIFNPAARGNKAHGFRAHLAEIAHTASLKPTTCAGDARRLAYESVAEGYDTIVAAGGDGTLNEVLNGIADAHALPNVRLGVLPLGTVNVFAKELSIPSELDKAWRVILAGRDRVIDAAWADYSTGGKPCRRYFAQLAGAGLDSRAIELVDWGLKKRIGPLSYVVAGLKALAGPLPDIEITNGPETARGQLVLIGNGKFYGGRFAVFPRADLTDGLLEAVVYPKVNLECVARGGWGMLTGNFHSGSNTRQLRGAHFALSCAASVFFQLEGENVARLPVTFGLDPLALRALVP